MSLSPYESRQLHFIESHVEKIYKRQQMDESIAHKLQTFLESPDSENINKTDREFLYSLIR